MKTPSVRKPILALPTVSLCAACSSACVGGPNDDCFFAAPPPMNGEFPGVGSFGARASVDLHERPGKSVSPARLTLSEGWSTVGFAIGLTLPMSQSQSRDFASGERVEFDEHNTLIYGETQTEFVCQGMRAIQLTLQDSGMVSVAFELGREWSRMDGVPADLGPVDGFWVSGALDVWCAIGESGVFYEEDARFESPFCRQTIVEYGLEDLARFHLERQNSK